MREDRWRYDRGGLASRWDCKTLFRVGLRIRTHRWHLEPAAKAYGKRRTGEWWIWHILGELV